MMIDKISVIIPVYNVEKYLSACLDSVLAQTYAELEILAVNDGSTDGSAKILEEYAERDSRIQVLNKPNGGLSDARNYGIEHATGQYYLFIDSDDLIRPDMADLLYRALIQYDADIAVSDMEYFYEDGTPSSYSSGGDFVCTNTAKDPTLIRINNSACNKLYRAELFADVRFPYGKFYEDLYTVPVLLYKAKTVVKVGEPLYLYRQRSGSIAHSSDPRIFDIYDAIDHVRDYVREHGNEAEILKQIDHLYVIHGLDLTTLRIKDFEDKSVRREYLKRNIRRLKRSYPAYTGDEMYKSAGRKKKLIWFLLGREMYNTVLKIYDR